MAGRARKVGTYVHVTNPATAERAVLAPGDSVPEWATDLVTNPKAFLAEDATPPGDDTSQALTSTPTRTAPAGGKGGRRPRQTAAEKRAAAATATPPSAASERAASKDTAPAATASTTEGPDKGGPVPGADPATPPAEGDEPPTFRP